MATLAFRKFPLWVCLYCCPLSMKMSDTASSTGPGTTLVALLSARTEDVFITISWLIEVAVWVETELSLKQEFLYS